jgi:hypothetical protein
MRNIHVQSDNLKSIYLPASNGPQKKVPTKQKSATMNFVSSAAAFAILSAPVVFAGGATELTLDTFDDKRGSKNAFVKFQAPW